MLVSELALERFSHHSSEETAVLGFYSREKEISAETLRAEMVCCNLLYIYRLQCFI